MIDHYRVTRLLGRGGMGEVFAARDMKLGRKVALKFVAPHQFESAATRERFLIEARLTARFSHPNIVTIYGVGEYAGFPYLALEHLEGQTLADRQRERQLSRGEAIRIGLAVAEALEEAHRNGVFHRDLKPGNVHLGRDGRVRVLDFGLAKSTDGTKGIAPNTEADKCAVGEARPAGPPDDLETKTFGVGTPAYMAPEQWLEDASTGATDIWAFGVLLFNALTGHLPFRALSADELALLVCGSAAVPRVRDHADVSMALDQLVAQCLQKNAGDRLTAKALVERLRGMIEGRGGARSESVSPFPGLLAFTRQDEHQFFGRDTEIGAFVERMRHVCILPVVGASGSGKSSFVQAGVFPRLVEQDRWTILTFRTGRDPFLALAARLVEGDADANTSERARGAFDAPTWLKQPANSGVPAPGENRPSEPMLDVEATRTSQSKAVVSEPSFRHATATRSGTHRRDVAALAKRLREDQALLAFELRSLAEARNSRVLLFVDQLEELFTHNLDDGTTRAFIEILCAATDDALDPIRVVFTIRDDFFGRLAVSPQVGAALGRVMLIQRPDALALEQTLTGPIEALGYAFEDPELPIEMVQSVEGEPSCLSLLQFTANLLWERRDQASKRLTRRAYQAIGGVEGALAGHADGVLRGLTATELEAARKLLLRLVSSDRTRKVVAKDEALDGLGPAAKRVLDLFIEARLIATTKLLDASLTGVIELAHECLIRNWGTLWGWVNESHDEVVLITQLEQATRLWHERGRLEEQLWRGDALLEARRLQRRVTTELPTPLREFLKASEFFHERQRRRKRGAVAAVLGIAGLIAIGAVLAALLISEERDRSEQRRAEALSEAARAALAQGNVLEARAKVRESLEVEDSVSGRVLWRKLQKVALDWDVSVGTRLNCVALAPDGRTVATGGNDGVIHLFDTVTRAHRALRGHTDQVFGVDYSADGRWLASAGLDRTVRIWNTTTGEATHVLGGMAEATHTVAFSPDSRLVAVGTYDGELRLWRMSDARELHAWKGHDAAVRGLSFSPDGTEFASGDAAGTVRFWNTETATVVGELRGSEGTLNGVAFSPDGKTLAIGGSDGALRLFDVQERREAAVLRGHRGGIHRTHFSPDGKSLASAGNDGRVQLWDVATHTVRGTYLTKGEASEAVFSNDGSHLAVASSGELLQLFRTDTPASEALRSHESAVNVAVLAPDGRRMASADNDGRVLVRDTKTGKVLLLIEAHGGPASAVALLPGGAGLVSAGGDGAVRLWSAEGALVRTLFLHPVGIAAMEVSEDGRTIVAGTYDGAVFTLDQTGTSVRTLGRGYGRIRAVALSRDGALVFAAGHDGNLRVWSSSDGSLVHDIPVGHGRTYGVAVHPAGGEVTVTSADGSIQRIELASEKATLLATAPTRCYAPDYGPRGAWIAVPCADGKLRIVPREPGPLRTLDLHENEANSARVSVDGGTIVTASDDGTVQLVDSESLTPRWRTTALVRLSTGEVATHSQRGWTTSDGRTLPPPATAYQSAAESAVDSAISPDFSRLCLATQSGEFELYDLRNDRLVSRTTASVHGLLASRESCLAVNSGGLLRLGPKGAQPIPVPGARVVAETEDGLVVATSERLLFLDVDGHERGRAGITSPVSSLAARGEFLLVGHRDGHIERRRRNGEPLHEFEGTFASPVVSLLAGPAGVWLAGFANGELGLWSGDDLRRLDAVRLHGGVAQLHLVAGVVHAATERGDSFSMDLSDLERPRCELLKNLRKAIPIVWRNGHAELQPSMKGSCR